MQKAKTKPKLSVIMPAFNEGLQIFDNLIKVCHTLKKQNYEIIVVDDGSSDNTYAESKRAAKIFKNIKPIQIKQNQGKGASLFLGFQKAQANLIAFLDADLEISPEHLIKLLSLMNKKKADVVAGVKDPIANRFPLPRRIASALYKSTVNFLFGLNITDTQTGIKIFKRQVLEDAIPRLQVSRFAFDIELLVAASRFGYNIIEYPVQVTYQRKGNLGRMKLTHFTNSFIDTFTIYFRASFWRWLEPSAGTQFWMIVFVLGVFLAGIGFAKILSPIILQPTLDKVSYIIFLRFIPTSIRDPMLTITGILTIVISLIQLNKRLLNAFARKDRGDLAGILRK
jgi:glycosyltransferase involved in cell wall biosynthesis